jgi:hypothetical protein
MRPDAAYPDLSARVLQKVFDGSLQKREEHVEQRRAADGFRAAVEMVERRVPGRNVTL